MNPAFVKAICKSWESQNTDADFAIMDLLWLHLMISWNIPFLEIIFGQFSIIS